MAIDQTTGRVTPYVPPGQAYTPPPPSTMAFPNVPLPPVYGEPIKLESSFPGVAPLTFDFQAEQQKAYTALKPFYDKLLSFAGGDLDMAKRILKYSYDQGMRETQADYEQSVSEQGLTFPKETEAQQTEQNRRGILESGFGGEDRKRLAESQGLRREAVERALKDRQSRISSEKGFGTEEAESAFTKSQFNLEGQKQKEASGMASDKFGIKQAIFGSQLAKASADDYRKTQAAQSSAVGNLLSGGGGGSYDPTGKTIEEQYAETGRQSELDALRKQGLA